MTRIQSEERIFRFSLCANVMDVLSQIKTAVMSLGDVIIQDDHPFLGSVVE